MKSALIPLLVPYHDNLPQRDPSTITLVVLHCTELPDMRSAIEYGARIVYPERRTGVCGHYYIDRNGAIYQFVAAERIANHVIGHNNHSIGIELVNLGRYPKWFSASHQTCADPYPEEQIEALRSLLKDLHHSIPSLVDIARHSDLDTTLIPAEDDASVSIRRKIDPGPMFPWESVRDFWQSLTNEPQTL